MTTDWTEVLHRVRAFQRDVRAHVIERLRGTDDAHRVAAEAPGDTIYAIDADVEPIVERFFRDAFAPDFPCTLIAEGVHGDEPLVLGDPRAPNRLRVLVDPIDGTRGLMYDKRPGWVLTAVAPDRGDRTRLSDVVVAVQTELPTTKMTLGDCAWAIAGERWAVEREDLTTGTRTPIAAEPSRAVDLEHGFAQIARFFAGGKDILATIEEALFREVVGPVTAGRARVFEDQYICNAGQLFELLTGRDRFTADVRPRLEAVLAARGEALGITSHPYDLGIALIARMAGVEITDPWGAPFDGPLDTTTPIGFIAYGNRTLRERIEPTLLRLLDEHLGDA